MIVDVHRADQLLSSIRDPIGPRFVYDSGLVAITASIAVAYSPMRSNRYLLRRIF